MTIRTSRFGVLLLFSLLVALLIGLVLTQQQQNMALGLWPRFNIEEVTSIEISVGSGYCSERKGMTPEDFIQMIDNRMYDEKRVNHRLDL